eukprot:1152401-Pelagomonas_calceolata.AAC.3
MLSYFSSGVNKQRYFCQVGSLLEDARAPLHSCTKLIPDHTPVLPSVSTYKRLRKLVYVCPRADQFRSAAAVVAFAESSLLAVTASRGNSEFALDSLKLCS